MTLRLNPFRSCNGVTAAWCLVFVLVTSIFIGTTIYLVVRVIKDCSHKVADINNSKQAAISNVDNFLPGERLMGVLVITNSFEDSPLNFQTGWGTNWTTLLSITGIHVIGPITGQCGFFRVTQ